MGYSSGLGILLLSFSYMIYKDSGLYLAEGIWSMEGALFWKAFIFETPFVLLRLLPVFMAVFFCISFYKAYRKYSMLKRNSATGLLSQGDGGQYTCPFLWPKMKLSLLYIRKLLKGGTGFERKYQQV